MYLRELVINGFKSFADRTRVQLDKGVTCIVGPNGCGKSNIVDAIRWVLGEQSAKAMRGSKMQDVIFQGTDRRKPLPSCEVSLVFSDCEAELGTRFNEVEITRRVDREGGGDYFINGKRCRLKDIQNLFMDTGVGRASYSFMMQGQIDQILSSNPQERRTIFEEAAGITRYKAQRKEALNKLSLVDQNLSRVTDVIEEVGRQIGSLKRQASKALRYQRIKHRLTHLDLAWNTFQYARRKAAVADVEKKAEQLRSDVSRLSRHLDEAEGGLEGRRSERAELFTALQEAQQAVSDLRSEMENAANQADFAEVRVGDISRRIEEIEAEVDGMESQRSAIDEQAASTEQDKQMALDLMGTSDEAFRERNDAFQGLLARLRDAEQRLDEYKRDLLIREGSLTRLRSQCTTLEVDLKTFQIKHSDLSDGLYQAREQGEVLAVRRDETARVLDERERQAEEAATGVAESQSEVQRLRGEFRELQKEIQEMDRTVARQSARLTTLEDLQKRFEGFSAGAKAILQGKLDEVLPRDEFHPLTALLDIDEGHAGAIETLLGGSADAVVLRDKSRTAEVLAALEERKLGRVCLQVETPTPGYVNKELPEWLVPAHRVARGRDDSARELVSSFLDGCYLCESLAQFLDFWRERADFTFTLVATQAGELVDRRGLVFGGGPRKGQQEESFIQRVAHIKRLRADIERDNETLTQLNERAMQLQADMDAADQAVEDNRKRENEIRQELSSLKAELRAAEQSLNENASAVNRQQKQLEELEANREDAEKRLADGRASLEGAETALTEQRDKITQTESDLQHMRAERDAHQEGLAEVRLELAEKRQRLELLDRGLTEARSQARQLDERLLRRRQEADTLRVQVEELRRDSEVQRARANEIEKTLSVTAETLQAKREALNTVEAAIREAENELGGERTELREKETALNGCEVKLAEERSQTNFLAEKVRTEYEREIMYIDWKAELWAADEKFETRLKLDDIDEDEGLIAKSKGERGEPTAEDFAAMDDTDWPVVEAEIRDLRNRIHSLGAVNLVAIEEYAELKERYDFLNSQSEDLWKSKEELLKAIDEINATSQKMFSETFEQIRKNFKFTFEKLFGGGVADLALIEAEDILDSGIEITARPPGTKLKTLSLLSGGQRTMTAVGLLFAIYMVKPSPFAVLDELDAPLDDANIGRFVGILKQFTKYSQFLVVTHSKRTVSAADSIYGVTMQERGVTRLVSMRFNSDTEEAIEVEEGGSGV
ncbi:chromosome segregation protein SMC [Ruficoccus amylovorans]|uniref:Chromosome partition protein Smc n=1 Tax=Ruficoccus amylovorans TaxID=1804625 RepID=A0A842HIM3_9BACT|nr:chromosome segregation protein SMC [Ruficoccus amylovorans]MBC2596363.1 chromosome segregation protein SMC [Ruficoccus amylovorans]